MYRESLTTKRRADPKPSKWDRAKNSDGKYECPKCHTLFNKPNGLGRHWAHAHPNESATRAMLHGTGNGTVTRDVAPGPSDPGPSPVPPHPRVTLPEGASVKQIVEALAPLRPDSGDIRRTCALAMAVRDTPEWRAASPRQRVDALAVLLERASREQQTAEAFLGDTSLDTMGVGQLQA
jgi:hypothetical protein